MPAPDTESFESRRPFLSTPTGTVESQRVLQQIHILFCNESNRGVDGRFCKDKSRNCPSCYRNSADFYGFFEKIVKNV